MSRKAYIAISVSVLAAGYLIYDVIAHLDLDGIKGRDTIETIPFDADKWKEKKSDQYIFREAMMDEILYSKELRRQSRNEVAVMLGEPDRETEGFLYYVISQKKIGFWPLNQKTLVFKLTEVDSVEWIKLHE